jgi:hypothetical protein
MKVILSVCVLLLLVSASGRGQSTAASRSATPNFDAEIALAKQAVEAHGGSKLREMRSLLVRGSVDVSTAASPQVIPATFLNIYAGSKYVFELNNPLQPFKQVYDGEQTSSSMRGFNLPPMNRLGFPLLQHLGEQGFIITSIPADKKKKKGFRMTSPEGFYTDFYLDEKTNQVKGFDSSFEVRGRSFTTSAEIEKYRLVDGVLVPERFVQRFDTDQLTIYANFKAKDIQVNAPVDEAIFKM